MAELHETRRNLKNPHPLLNKKKKEMKKKTIPQETIQLFRQCFVVVVGGGGGGGGGGMRPLRRNSCVINYPMLSSEWNMTVALQTLFIVTL